MDADEAALNLISLAEEVLIGNINNFPFPPSHIAHRLLKRFYTQMQQWVDVNFDAASVVISAHFWARPASGLYTFRVVLYFPGLLEDDACLYESSYQTYRRLGEKLTVAVERPICTTLQYDEIMEFSDEYVPVFMLQ
jgi:hypothetical protein